MGYAVQLTKDEGLPTMVKRGAGFVRRRFFGKRARYLPGKKVLEAQAAEMVGKTAENCGLPTISILTPLYNTPENYLREFLGSFVNQTAPNGQLCLADASDDAHPEVERVVREYQRKNQRIVYKKEQKQYIKGIAAAIKKEYTPVLKHMTRTQGRVLLKLIDRETKYTAYEILREFRGGFVAGFWQSVSRIFGQNLKSEYDREGDDKVLEQIVLYYEAGLL